MHDARVEELEGQLANARKACKVQGRNDHLRSRLTDAQASMSDLQSENATLRALLDETQKECATLVAKVQQYEEDAAVTLAESDKQVKTLVSAQERKASKQSSSAASGRPRERTECNDTWQHHCFRVSPARRSVSPTGAHAANPEVLGKRAAKRVGYDL